ncbi:unnamed protein product, partial [Brassica rapa subsp. trilocularis]
PSPFPWLWFCWIVDRDIGFPLSVPVLSWLFDARGKLPKEPFPVRPPADTRRSALATLAAQAARQQSTDLHRRPLRSGSRPRFCSDRRALLLIEAGSCPDGRV